MADFQEGDKVRFTDRPLKAEDNKAGLYGHMLGVSGTVENIYGDELTLKADVGSLGEIQREVHAEATRRMREKFASKAPEEAKKGLTKEELDFTPNFVLLARQSDLELVE